jgi:hypothetical protein
MRDSGCVQLPLGLCLAILLGPAAAAQGIGAGAVPDGDTVPGQPLLLSKAPGGELSLTWSPSCRPDTDYAIYSGELGDFASHGPSTCSTDGASTDTLTPGAGDRYYLVVPHNGSVEGSYGSRSDHEGRPRGYETCVPQIVECGGVPPNASPQGGADDRVTPVGQRIVIDVLANDVDPDDGPLPLAVASASSPRDGTAIVLSTNEISYTPNPGFTGLDTFEYTLTDGLDPVPVPLSINVGPPPTDPTCALFAASDNIAMGESSTLTWSSVGGVRAYLNGGQVVTAGELVVSPITTATYTLEVEGQEGTVPTTCQRTVTVSNPPCVNNTFCPVACGAGILSDLKTGNAIALEPQEMVHLVLLAEGYTVSDLDQFHVVPDSDVGSWLDLFYAIDVYSAFEEAFCIWKYPAVSNENTVPGGGVEDTAFRVYVNDVGGGQVELINPEILSGVRDRVWQAIDSHPFPPESFYDPGGRMDARAKNLVAAMMIYSPTAMGESYGGATFHLVDPDDPTRKISTAIARARPHEFSHAFGGLWDEYLADTACQPNASAFESRGLSNSVCDRQCALLPWKHLLPGGPISPALPGLLVGAFGRPGDGYHPELKCLLNGDTNSNAGEFGGTGDLRTNGRMCNYCRELTVFRLFERIHRFDDEEHSYASWEAHYRMPFFEQYGFALPSINTEDNDDVDGDGMPDIPQQSAFDVTPTDYECAVIP